MYIHTHTYEYTKTDLERRQFMHEALASVSPGIRQEHNVHTYTHIRIHEKRPEQAPVHAGGAGVRIARYQAGT